MPPQDSEQALWFDAHLRPHEAMLRAWLRGQFPTCFDIDDVVQEAFVRVLQAQRVEVIESPKAFLFATARNIVLMQIRHRQVEKSDSIAETRVESILDEVPDVPTQVARAQELELLTKAIQSLPTRCREVITLRKIYGLSQKEVGARLGISEHTVEAQSTIGLTKIGEFFERFDCVKGVRRE